MIGTDKQVIEALKVQRNQYADDCAELKAAWDAALLRIAQLEKENAVYKAIGAEQMQAPEDGGHQGTPAVDEHGVAAP